MKRWLALLLALSAMGAAAGLSGAQPVRSVSGLFVVHPGSGFTSRFYRGDATAVSREPAVLAIAAERVKTALWRLLDANAPASGKIHLRMRPARQASEQPSIVIDRAFTGWVYRIDIPDSISPGGFVSTLVHACLLEMANRHATDRSAEVPLWLAEGLAQELLSVENLEQLLPPAKGDSGGLALSRIIINERRRNPIAHIQALLKYQTPLTFEQLSWPSVQQLSGSEIDLFRCSAQLFVHQLCRLNQGRTCLRATVEQLSSHLNWQFALLSGFAPHFKTQLEVEKWWALQLVQFTGRDPLLTYTLEASWDRLAQVVQAPVDVRTNPLELPQRSEVSLQTVIQNWDGVSQRATLQRKLRELELLRLRIAPELVTLVDDYRSLLAGYLDRQKFSGSFFGLRAQVGPIRNRIADNAIRELNVLDSRRHALKPASPSPAALSAMAP